jgi:hypothetical protein
MADSRGTSNVNLIAVVVALVGAALLLAGYIFRFPW